MDELLVDVAEAARRLGIGRSQMYELLASEQVPRLKIGRRTLVPVQALRAFIDDRLAAQKAVVAASEPRNTR
jgi:excisionase family DNA binding protein